MAGLLSTSMLPCMMRLCRVASAQLMTLLRSLAMLAAAASTLSSAAVTASSSPSKFFPSAAVEIPAALHLARSCSATRLYSAPFFSQLFSWAASSFTCWMAVFCLPSVSICRLHFSTLAMDASNCFWVFSASLPISPKAFA